MWIPTGDSQLDSLLRLKAAVDQNNLLTGWTTAGGRNGGYCSWDFVTCDAAGKTVEVSQAEVLLRCHAVTCTVCSTQT
jgi:hypothetical protein